VSLTFLTIDANSGLRRKIMEKNTAPWETKRKLLIRAEEKTDPQYGCKPEERPIKDYIRLGIINLDKTAGPSSHEITAWVKRILTITHAGHGGTLEAFI
jgi:H/ACA ribonucleoprotein complex subunit 4